MWAQLGSEALAVRIGAALGVTVAFAALARWLRGVSPSGTIAGALASFLLYVCAGPGAFLALASVFGLALVTTRLGYSRKQRLGTAERSEGRNASQVLANLGVAVAAAVLFVLRGNSAFLLATAAALAEAAADTVSSEYGQASSEHARLITTWRVVAAGSDGGITWAGTMAGVIAALLVTLICALVRLIPWFWLAVAAGAAILGTLVDSFLGAWLERRHLLDNDQVNFLSTLAAALVAFVTARILR